MRRRDLLRYLLAAPIAATLDVEKLLWVPGEKTIFIPPAPVIPVSLYGVPYHMSDHVTGVWLGIVREKNLTALFDRDDTFYEAVKKGKVDIDGHSRRG